MTQNLDSMCAQCAEDEGLLQILRHKQCNVRFPASVRVASRNLLEVLQDEKIAFTKRKLESALSLLELRRKENLGDQLKEMIQQVLSDAMEDFEMLPSEDGSQSGPREERGVEDYFSLIHQEGC